MDIKISQITDFQNLDSFSYEVKGKTKRYTHLNNKIQFSKPKLALHKNGDFVIKFQNIFERAFDAILTTLHIRHTTTDSEKVWTALQDKKIVSQDQYLPKNTEVMNQKFAEAVQKLKGSKGQKPSPATSPTETSSFATAYTPPTHNPETDISMEVFQKLTLYFEENNNEEAKKILDGVKDLNGHFEKAIDTPLTLAIKKENLAMMNDLLSRKDSEGKPLVDPTIRTRDNLSPASPLLIAAKKDLPRRYIMALIDAGAKPLTEQEYNDIIAAAGGLTDPKTQHPLVNAMIALKEHKSVSWSEPTPF